MRFSSALAFCTSAALVKSQESCPGYRISNVQLADSGLTAALELAGPACNIYGTDLSNLTLTVQHQSGKLLCNFSNRALANIRADTRLLVKIEDYNKTIYQVPGFIVPRPNATPGSSESTSELKFNYTEDPFSFTVSRTNGEVIFDTSSSPLIFESQYLNLRTLLPNQPNLYGLGEHSDPFRLNTTNYTRTIWARDAYSVPPGTNLYGAHPIYIDHRGTNGSHGVVLVNSNGMDIKINNTDSQYLEYNILGGVFEFYFVAGPTPIEAAQQISEVVGKPAMIPYAGLGYHNCRYGYRDVYQVAEVVHNYSAADIPLETMWTDIDYMDLRRVFTLDPERYPLEKVRELVDYLHAHQQHYVVMVDPAVAVNSSAYTAGHGEDAFMKTANGSDFRGVVWPGVTVFPDWFSPSAQEFWTQQFASFFDKDTGVDIDFLWIDMNEPSNFCNYPCSDPDGFAVENNDPPAPPPVRDGPAIALPGFPADFQPPTSNHKRQASTPGSMLGLPNRDLLNPMYSIQNAAGSLSNKTLNTDLAHYGGYVEYDTHNMYGTMMSNASRQAMLSRRPGIRPLIITRSTFIGAGSYVSHWLGDNISDWPHYRISIAQMLQFASIFQVPMVGSDVCGFGGNTTESLCARWMMLGAFSPFYRNHNEIGNIPQEAYRWPSVAAAARYAIDIRYRLMDYFYTEFWQQSQSGTPAINPVFYLYPNDSNTFSIEHQFFYGNALLVSPVTEENGTSVEFYLPNDIFYDWNNGFTPVKGEANNVTMNDVGFQTIPLHLRGGTIIPARAKSANTTTELRKQPFHLIVAPGSDGAAAGSLYLDEGSMIDQPATTMVNMTYANGTFTMKGEYGYGANTDIEIISFLGISSSPSAIRVAGAEASSFEYNSTTMVVSFPCRVPLTSDITITMT